MTTGIERGQARAYYLNGGGGDPRYFDHLSCIRGVERSGKVDCTFKASHF
jgi:hypothetical protein